MGYAASYWCVAQTESQREKVAAKFLEAASYGVYLPRILVKKDREAPLFPGYLFVEIIEQWWAVRRSVGVLRVLMAAGQPARVPGKVVAAIKRREGADGLVKLPRARGELESGDAVRIVRGSFAGHLAIFEGMNGATRVCVLLDLLGRKVPVSLGRDDVASAGGGGGF